MSGGLEYVVKCVSMLDSLIFPKGLLFGCNSLLFRIIPGLPSDYYQIIV